MARRRPPPQRRHTNGKAARSIENNSSPGQAVYEPFCGSGTTIIAAEMTGRACHAIELDPAYVDVAVLRWQAFTGEAAILEGDGRSFDEVKAERAAAGVLEPADQRGGGVMKSEALETETGAVPSLSQPRNSDGGP